METDAAPPIRYEDTTTREWNQRARELVAAGKLHVDMHVVDGTAVAVTVHGECPRCTHPHSDNSALSAVIFRDGRNLAAKRNARPIGVKCRCSETHEGAPKDVHGCGLLYFVSLDAWVERAGRKELISAAKRSLWKVIEQEHGGFVTERSGPPLLGAVDIIRVQPDESNELFAPLFQFGSDQQALSVVIEINRHLLVQSDPWGALSWWATWNGWLGCAPIDLLGGAREAEASLAAALVKTSVS